MVSLEAQKKLENLIEKAYRKTNGNRIRQLVKVVANAYKENPEELRNYFKRETKSLESQHQLTIFLLKIFLQSKTKATEDLEFQFQIQKKDFVSPEIRCNLQKFPEQLYLNQ
jgi:hypothetical protein